MEGWSQGTLLHPEVPIFLVGNHFVLARVIRAFTSATGNFVKDSDRRTVTSTAMLEAPVSASYEFQRFKTWGCLSEQEGGMHEIRSPGQNRGMNQALG